MRKHLLLGMVLLWSWAVKGQEKYEREYRIDTSEVPASAKKFVADAFPHTKHKWYEEINLTDTTYEAKLKHKGKLHSIEFTKGGDLMDVEVTVKWSDVAPHHQSALNTTLTDIFGKFKIDKVQEQFLSNEQSQKLYLSDKSSLEEVQHYEIVLCVKQGGTFTQYEVLLDPKGNLIRKSKIIQSNADVISY